MAYWIGWIVKPFIKDPGKRTGRRRRAEEPPNPELNFTDDAGPPIQLPVLPAPPEATDGINSALDFGPPANALALARNDRYRTAGKLLTWFWLAMGLLFIAPFLIVILGFILGYVGSFFVADVPQATRDFFVVEEDVNKRYEGAWSLRELRQISDAQLADKIEKEVLPSWRAAGQRFGALKNVPGSDRPLVALVNEYIQVRQEAMEMTVAALRSGDPQAMEGASAKTAAAERIFEKLAVSLR